MSEPIPQIDPVEVRRRLVDGENLLLLDCREVEEVDAAALDGAVHIPMGDIPANLQRLDPETPTIVFCHQGVRSLSVTHFLLQQDFDEVHSMRGGIDAWSRTVDPSIPRY